MHNGKFRLEVWNALERVKWTQHFIGTKKGMIREIDEYADSLFEEYLKQSRITDIREFIDSKIQRDMRE